MPGYNDSLEVTLSDKVLFRDEDPTFFSTDPDPDPAQLEKYSGSGAGSDLKSK